MNQHAFFDKSARDSVASSGKTRSCSNH